MRAYILIWDQIQNKFCVQKLTENLRFDFRKNKKCWIASANKLLG